MIAQILDVAKLIAYAWSLTEVATLASLYLYAYRKGKRSEVIRGLFFLLGAFSFSLAYRFLFVYTSHLTTDLHNTYRQLVILPLIVIIITARHFRKVSTETGRDKIAKHIRVKKNGNNKRPD